MKKISLLSLILLLFVSCGYSVYDSTGHLICKDKTDCGEEVPEVLGVPSSSSKFTKVLNQSYLQYPDTEKEVKYFQFDGYVSSFFYLENELLTFQLDKQNYGKLRSELRFGKGDWYVSDNDAHILKARLKCYSSNDLPKYTFIQIHGNMTFNLPLLRLTWEKKHTGKINHLWAIIMTSHDLVNKTYDWVDLGERRNGFFDVEVFVQNNFMKITIDGKVFVEKDISYWVDVENYYKAGLYLSDKQYLGKSKLQFEKLEYIIK